METALKEATSGDTPAKLSLRQKRRIRQKKAAHYKKDKAVVVQRKVFKKGGQILTTIVNPA